MIRNFQYLVLISDKFPNVQVMNTSVSWHKLEGKINKLLIQSCKAKAEEQAHKNEEYFGSQLQQEQCEGDEEAAHVRTSSFQHQNVRSVYTITATPATHGTTAWYCCRHKLEVHTYLCSKVSRLFQYPFVSLSTCTGPTSIWDPLCS